MSVRGALRRGRAAHERLMLDQCEITRAGGEPVFDPETGQYTDPPPITVYSGRCRAKPWTAAFDMAAGEQEIVLRRYIVMLPQDSSAEVNVGDTFTTTSSSDEWLVGEPLAVVGVEFATARTARRITVESAA